MDTIKKKIFTLSASNIKKKQLRIFYIRNLKDGILEWESLNNNSDSLTSMEKLLLETKVNMIEQAHNNRILAILPYSEIMEFSEFKAAVLGFVDNIKLASVYYNLDNNVLLHFDYKSKIYLLEIQ